MRDTQYEWLGLADTDPNYRRKIFTSPRVNMQSGHLLWFVDMRRYCSEVFGTLNADFVYVFYVDPFLCVYLVKINRIRLFHTAFARV